MIKLTYDLHIHSCLSPCGDGDMTPANIVNMALIKELDVIAVTDHNSSKNCPALMAYAEEMGIVVIPGMELCTMEEVHVLCLFTDLEDAMNFDEYVSDKLIKIPNNEDIFGKQEIYHENDIKVGDEPYLLINATNISFSDLGRLMSEYHGIYIPAHIDKGSNSLISNLGFIPPDADFHCVEMKDIGKKESMIYQYPYLNHCIIITNSDSHYLEHIHEPDNYIYVVSKSREDILRALVNENVSPIVI